MKEVTVDSIGQVSYFLLPPISFPLLYGRPYIFNIIYRQVLFLVVTQAFQMPVA